MFAWAGVIPKTCRILRRFYTGFQNSPLAVDRPRPWGRNVPSNTLVSPPLEMPWALAFTENRRKNPTAQANRKRVKTVPTHFICNGSPPSDQTRHDEHQPSNDRADDGDQGAVDQQLP